MAGTATRYRWWWQSGGTPRPYVPPPPVLRLSDFDQTGLTVLFAALIESGGSGSEKYYTSATPPVGAILDGNTNIDSTTSIGRVRVQQSGDRILLNRSGSGSLQTFFGAASPVYPDVMLHIQTLDGVSVGPWLSGGASVGRFDPMDDDDIADNIGDGERFIIALSYTPSDASLLRWGTTDRLLWGTDQLSWN